MDELFGGTRGQVSLDRYEIEIIAEINHAPRMTVEAVVSAAEKLRSEGADRIDVGCDPGRRFEGVATVVRELVSRGMHVSIDSFDPWEVEQAAEAGADLVLSVNQSNREASKDWGIEVVAIPDIPSDLPSLDATIEYLTRNNVPMRLDPILEPIGAGMTNSLLRYADVRRRYPELAMMMGIGNLTELSDVDSAGVNLILLGICAELGIESVLTTQVINWARSSVRECDWARRLVAYAVKNSVPPKNVSDDLVMLRDPRLRPFPNDAFEELASALKDNNYRLFAQDGEIHLLSADTYLRDSDPFALFESLMQQPISDNVDAGHAFYLGYEMAKAMIALNLGKQYEQDRALRWGMLTQEEDLHRLKRSSRHRRGGSSEPRSSEPK